MYAHVWCVVVETEVVVYDGVVRVVGFEEVLQRAGTFLCGGFDIVRWDGGDVDGGVVPVVRAEEGR